MDISMYQAWFISQPFLLLNKDVIIWLLYSTMITNPLCCFFLCRTSFGLLYLQSALFSLILQLSAWSFAISDWILPSRLTISSDNKTCLHHHSTDYLKLSISFFVIRNATTEPSCTPILQSSNFFLSLHIFK